MEEIEDQQFCLRWNNFQANFTSQFETLRDDEDFTDVTIACEGQKLQAHKVVLSACSPYFKELFKANPCSHPIIFMRDVEAQHIVALMEFMYAGEVNVAQANLSSFLKTAESLKIRGLTDTSSEIDIPREQNTIYLNPQPSKSTSNKTTKFNNNKFQVSSSTAAVTSSQDVKINSNESRSSQLEIVHKAIEPKIELPDYLSDDEIRDGTGIQFFEENEVTELGGGMEMIPQTPSFEHIQCSTSPSPFRRKRKSEDWLLDNRGEFSSTTLSFREGNLRNKLIKLGEGIEIYEDQLRSVKWNDYRKLTRGLATILFSPAELATCSVTGQRWSRAGSGERPVKPALNRTKVQAIISYVATRFPMVEISRIKQVLAYKCKENSTAFRMKAVRYYGDKNPNELN